MLECSLVRTGFAYLENEADGPLDLYAACLSNPTKVSVVWLGGPIFLSHKDHLDIF